MEEFEVKVSINFLELVSLLLSQLYLRLFQLLVIICFQFNQWAKDVLILVGILIPEQNMTWEGLTPLSIKGKDGLKDKRYT